MRTKSSYVLSRRYKKSELGSREVKRTDMTGLPNKVQLQLNDTHPALAIPELMRLLVDIEGLDWETVRNTGFDEILGDKMNPTVRLG